MSNGISGSAGLRSEDTIHHAKPQVLGQKSTGLEKQIQIADRVTGKLEKHKYKLNEAASMPRVN